MTHGPIGSTHARRVGFVTGDGYAPRYLAAKHGITTQQARDLIAEVGTDRERLNMTATAVKVNSRR